MPLTNQPETSSPEPPAQQNLALTDAVVRHASAGRTVPFSRRALVHFILICICFFSIVPFLWMMSTSLKTGQSATAYPPQIIPHPAQPQNYWEVLDSRTTYFLLWTRNTLIVEILSVAGITLSSAVVAYGFAKIRFFGRDVLFIIMLCTMMIPFQVTMVPLFSLFRWLGDHTGTPWLGTFKPLWVPAWFGSAFSIFLLRQFFLTIPNELSEAARIDGCNELGIFLRIILPLSKPALAVITLFAFMNVWNDFLAPLVYLQRPEQFTLSLGLQNYQSQLGGTPWQLLMAASVLVIIPVLLLFFLAQRVFVQGLTTTGIKG